MNKIFSLSFNCASKEDAYQAAYYFAIHYPELIVRTSVRQNFEDSLEDWIFYYVPQNQNEVQDPSPYVEIVKTLSTCASFRFALFGPTADEFTFLELKNAAKDLKKLSKDFPGIALNYKIFSENNPQDNPSWLSEYKYLGGNYCMARIS